ncbi:NTP transferase domain-containing protein [Aneurinibacillus migulanus]|uniref:NTP transferase domain-containing protein n=1 Tax=Aneurinibacillus migulanus TaxID=47500 RepID=UPI002E1F71AD|nr:NTP transferase domain-containing protein [Aneurinibacillus migulanus]
MKSIAFTVNGQTMNVSTYPAKPLLDVLRDDLNLTGSKECCGKGECGSCSIILEGEAVCSCLILTGQVEGKKITTIEGIGTVENMDPLQKAFAEEGAHVIKNRQWEQGKSASVIRGISALDSECGAVLLVNVDQPVPSNSINQLIDSHQRLQGKIHLPVFQGRRGHPVLFSTELLPDLREISEECQGVKSIIRKYDTEIVHVPMTDPSVLYNFNTPADYEKGGQTCEFRK